MKDRIKGYYEAVLNAEKIPAVPLVFCRVAKGGACVVYNAGMKPIEVQLDMNRCKDYEFALLHEIAHLRMLFSKGYPGHNASFKKEEVRLNEKYMYSELSFKFRI